MCGIIGIIGKGEVAPLLVDGLRRLEYRGYDSAGIATVVNGAFERRRAEGKLVNLESLLAAAHREHDGKYPPEALESDVHRSTRWGFL